MSSSPFTIDVGQVMKACPRVLLSKVSKNGENMADIRSLNDYYTELASELIKTEDALRYIFDSNVTIIYLSSQAERKSKGRITCGECEKKLKHYYSTSYFTLEYLKTEMRKNILYVPMILRILNL